MSLSGHELSCVIHDQSSWIHLWWMMIRERNVNKSKHMTHHDDEWWCLFCSLHKCKFGDDLLAVHGFRASDGQSEFWRQSDQSEFWRQKVGMPIWHPCCITLPKRDRNIHFVEVARQKSPRNWIILDYAQLFLGFITTQFLGNLWKTCRTSSS